MQKNILTTLLVACFVILTGCKYLASKNPDQETNSRREQMCANLKDKMIFSRWEGSAPSGSSGQTLPTDTARMMKAYSKYDCSGLEQKNDK